MTGRRLLDRERLFVGEQVPGRPITYWDANGTDVAYVSSRDPVGLVDLLGDEIVRHTAEAWEVSDDEGVVFRLRRYDAADHPSYDVIAGDGAPLATFLCEGGVLHEHV